CSCSEICSDLTVFPSVNRRNMLIIRKMRRGRESNPRIAVLQTATLPLGYPAIARGAKLSSAAKRCQRRQKWGDGVIECWSNEKRDTRNHPSTTPVPLCRNTLTL